MEFRILGPLEVRVAGEPVELGRGKQGALLAMLLLNAGDVVSTDRLIDALWGEEAPAGARNSVHIYVSQLRKALGNGRLVTRGHGYLLAVEPGELDVERFEELFQRGRSLVAGGDPGAAVEVLQEALRLWRGRPLVGFEFEPFAQVEMARLDELRIAALEQRIDAELSLGRGGELVPELEALVREHPLRERLRGQLMLALYRSGRQADALEAYRHARRTLLDELGLEPTRALKDLERAILAQDPALDAPAPPATPASRRDRRRPLLWAAAGLLVAGVAIAIAALLSGPDYLTGVDANALASIDPQEARIAGQIPLVGRPTAIATGGGFVWTAAEADGTVARIDPETGVARTLGLEGRPAGIAFGGGSLWVADSAANLVAQVDPRSMRVVQTFAVGNGPAAVAVGGGSVWVANSLEGTVSRIDLDRAAVTKTIPVGADPAGIAVGAGAVWVTSEGSGTVLRVAARSGRLEDSIGVGNGPTGIAFGEGGVWVANTQDGTLSSIDPATGSVAATVRVGTSPTSVAAGLGAVWVASGGDGTVSRVDPDSAAVDETISMRSSPDAIALAGGKVWATTVASSSDHRGGLLRVEVRSAQPCGCFDPAFAAGMDEDYAVSMAHDALLAYRRVGGIAGGKLVGDLAIRVPRPTEDGRSYAFQLRDGIRFSDGSPVRAADVRYSLERTLTINPDGAPFLSGIVGAPDCRPHGRERCDLSRGIAIDNEAGTLTIRLRAPDPDFVHWLTLAPADVVPEGTPIRRVRGPGIPATGPYRLTGIDPGHVLRLARNPRFHVWSRDARPDGYPDAIRIHFTDDLDASVRAVERGRADWMLIYPVEPRRRSVRRLMTTRVGQLHPEPVTFTEWMFLNTREPPFDDRRVRRALNYAVDRSAIVDLLGGPLAAQPTCQILPPGLPGYRPYCPYTRAPTTAQTWAGPDLPRARALIDASGTGGMRIQVYGRTERPQFARYFASLLRRLGYRTSVRLLPGFDPDPSVDYFHQAGDRRNHVQIGAMNWFPAFVSASDFLPPTFGCGSLRAGGSVNPNMSQFCDPKVEADMRKAADLGTSDPARSATLWAKADRALVDRAAAVPLVNPRALIFVSRRVGNEQFHPQWSTLLDQLWVR